MDGYAPQSPFYRLFFGSVASFLTFLRMGRAFETLLSSDRFITYSEDDKNRVVIVSDKGRGENTG